MHCTSGLYVCAGIFIGGGAYGLGLSVMPVTSFLILMFGFSLIGAALSIDFYEDD